MHSFLIWSNVSECVYTDRSQCMLMYLHFGLTSFIQCNTLLNVHWLPWSHARQHGPIARTMPKGAGSAGKDDGSTVRRADYITINKAWGVSLIICYGCVLLFFSPSFTTGASSFFLLSVSMSLSSFVASSFPLSLTRPGHFTFLPFLTPFVPFFPLLSLTVFRLLSFPILSFLPLSFSASHFLFFPPSYMSLHVPCPLLSFLLSHSLFLSLPPTNPFSLPCHPSISFSPSFLSIYFLLLPSLQPSLLYILRSPLPVSLLIPSSLVPL